MTVVSRSRGLSEVLASPALARLVLFFLLFPEEAPCLRELQRRTRIGSRSLQNEIARMQWLGWISLEEDGLRRRVRVCDAEEVWRPLWGLSHRVARPEEVLSVAFAEVEGIEGAFIYGSVARGEEREDSDVDVLLVGEAGDRTDLGRRSLEASVLLGREVNATVYTRATIRERGERGFLKRILQDHKIWIVGGPEVLLEHAA